MLFTSHHFPGFLGLVWPCIFALEILYLTKTIGSEQWSKLAQSSLKELLLLRKSNYFREDSSKIYSYVDNTF